MSSHASASTAAQPFGRTMAAPPARSYSRSDPIDLTLDDDDDAASAYQHRICKRPCTDTRDFNASRGYSGDDESTVYHAPQSSNLTPLMSTSTLHSPMAQSPIDRSFWSHPAHSIDPPPFPSTPNTVHTPQFTGPSNSSAFHLRQLPSQNGATASHVSPPSPLPHANPEHSSNGSERQVIDLTSSPSPPPGPPRLQQPQNGNLPVDLPPKTPVCIGQLSATALVLYPIPYLLPQDHVAADSDWAPVRLCYEHTPHKAAGQETIHIKTPPMRTPTGEIVPGENFGVVEQKVATYLGPMLGKGLIRLDAKVRRGPPTLPILPLQMLVYTPKGNIPVVANFLHQSGLFLDHPTLPSDVQRVMSQYYYNPHNPPPGGHARALTGIGRLGYSGPGGSGMSRWATPAVSGKSVEVQRSQVDELFKSLKDGDELEETEAPPEIATTLYPHQKKALTFLLERERERPAYGGHYSSLWQERFNPISGQRSWYHIVTQRETFTEPHEAKSAILADDMGLGKTIACVALMAATMKSAREFAATPLVMPEPPPSEPAEPALNAAHFDGSVWGMPPPQEASSSKKKAQVSREHDKQRAEYIRLSRIKAKSRATLIVCPLSTVVNWEDQFREHWRGEVTVVGGGASVSTPCTPQNGTSSGSLHTFASSSQTTFSVDEDVKPPALKMSTRVREGAPLRVYVYHGNARKADPAYLADFDAVITTYATLATEFSKQMKSMVTLEEEDEEENSSDDDVDRDNDYIKLPKPKKASAKKRKKGAGANGYTELSSPLQSVYWFRVVLDEAHSIKEPTTIGCRASCDLLADRRLCLTGTPVQNKLDDVYALIKFLRLEPLDDKAVWTEFIGTPVKYGQPLGVVRLQTIMKCITLRRTKESKAEDGKRILSLPPRKDELRYLKFDKHEQEIYDQYFTESKAEFRELSNKNEVMKNYVGILQKILRLRQICDHYELVQQKRLAADGSPLSYDDVVAIVAREGLNSQRASTIFALLRETGATQCVECGCELAGNIDGSPGDGSLAEGDQTPGSSKRGRKSKAASRTSTRQNSPSVPRPILTRCQHLFCSGCFRSSIAPGWPNASSDAHWYCSICQTPLAVQDVVEVNPDLVLSDQTPKKKSVKKEKRQKGGSLENVHMSTKIKALLNDLIVCSKANPYSTNYDPASIEVQVVDKKGNSLEEGIVKTVVFSQWTTMLDKIEDALEVAGIRYDRLDGTMKRDERTRAMEALKNDPGCEVLLVSLKAGGVGLNLTAAQRVYLMDPYWNPAVENQAVDRIHRLGQTRPVTTVKFIIEHSIEARLLEVQRKKTELANMTLGTNFTKAEMLQRRMEELNALFGGP
ncbi:uncharacterized protein LAESUDRAFT_730152 [Laetiporus sulphureus 93-53]|uniref:SNF2 family DNA-dependent ATPase domain-containing protein n=1 Tax=Laetiporus sulphureus 93-53 TaxID=1314785 RepID=A0A165C914_9APHY|nr:uncharacterized protein LAESUDRAFT_730152 [Laetiporus sulphureus 93-53]KZT02408.1 hypothetical protein LAESUDRAFT_730152 [Laetiporus sulphureus 93-53]